jgi:uncharacterized membrane protein
MSDEASRARAGDGASDAVDVAALLARVPLFEPLGDDDRRLLAARVTRRPVAAGEVVFREGDDGGAVFVIASGAVEITTGPPESVVSLATLVDGQYFGELSILGGAPRSATATAVRGGVLLALERGPFVAFVEARPAVALGIMAELGERIRQVNLLMSRQVARDVLSEAEERLTFGQRVADRVASFGGSWPFLGLFGLGMSVWMGLNVAHAVGFDPYPFILLNLVLSTLAALQAPIIMMSQNRQAAKDKLLAQNDYLVNLKAERGVEALLKQHAEIMYRLAQLQRAVEAPERARARDDAARPQTSR